MAAPRVRAEKRGDTWWVRAITDDGSFKLARLDELTGCSMVEEKPRKEPSKGAKIALVVFTAVVAVLVGAIVVGGLVWVAGTIWSAVL